MKRSSTRVLPRAQIIAFLCLLITLLWTIQALPGRDKRTEVEALTRSVIGLRTASQNAPANKRSKALENLIDAIVERQALLAELIETDTGFVLRTAIPPNVRSGMPAEVRDFIEQHRVVEGEMVVLYEDFDDGSHRLRYALSAEGKRVSLYLNSGRALD